MALEFHRVNGIGFGRCLKRVIRTPELSPVEETYNATVWRVESMGYLPIFAFFAGRAFERKSSGLPDIQLNGSDIAGSELMQGSLMRDPLRSLLDAIIIQTYSAFEVLAEQILVAAEAVRPNRTRGGDAGRIHTDGQVRLSNPDNCRSLWGIQACFSKTFDARKTDCEAIDRALSGRPLASLSATRNVLTHKGGKVDSKFVTQTSGIFDSEAPKDGDELPIDGRFTEEMVKPTAEAGYQLLEAVDYWLIANSSGRSSASAANRRNVGGG